MPPKGTPASRRGFRPLGCLLQLAGVSLLFMGLALMAWLVRSMYYSAHHDAMREQCQSNLEQLGLALEAYHDDFGCYPPATLPGADGQPAHSWRILLAPYLGASHVYEQYSFDEPWNGVHNSQLALDMPSAFACPASPERQLGHTSYVAVVGPGLFWDPAVVRRRGDVRDPLYSTIVLVETAAAEPPFQWLAPRDLELPRMSLHLNRFEQGGPASLHTGGFVQVLLANGQVLSLEPGLAPRRLRAGLTIAGSEPSALPGARCNASQPVRKAKSATSGPPAPSAENAGP